MTNDMIEAFLKPGLLPSLACFGVEREGGIFCFKPSVKTAQARRKKPDYGGAEIRFIYITQQII